MKHEMNEIILNNLFHLKGLSSEICLAESGIVSLTGKRVGMRPN
jgi:hypothetical protein